MTGKDRPPGGDSRGPEDTSPAGRGSTVMEGHDADVVGMHCFGQPSSYSLTRAELTAEVRRRRREGWQGWEIRARFDFGTVAHAA